MALRQEEFTSLCDDVDLDRDRVLVERCQAGDTGAFGNLYARYYERLLRFCLRRLNDRHEAEDATQEAFARAWKALPNFAGERRFYPWLTVIAGNICTDMLRRRSRSTPTDDIELGAHQQVGGGAFETSEELVLAAVDGELVNKALDRLSVRHRHVLAMREGSGWTYQQIADHEGVEIGTIETLLWRARQALKREFTVLSESKGMLGGIFIGVGALLRRGYLRLAQRTASLQQSGGAGGLRNAVAGVALTSAAVAAALITPHAFSGSGASASTPAGSSALGAASVGFIQPGQAGSAGLHAPGTTGVLPTFRSAAAGGGNTVGTSGGGGHGGGHGGGSISGLGGGGTLSGLPGLTGGKGGSGAAGAVGKGVTSTVGGVTSTATGTLGSVTKTGSSVVSTVTKALGSTLPSLGVGTSGGSGSVLPSIPPVTKIVPTPTTLPPPVSTVVKNVTKPVKKIIPGLGLGL